jgi:hypothetical protein
VQAFTLTNGAYELTAEGTGETAISVTEPVAVTVIPRDLVDC